MVDALSKWPMLCHLLLLKKVAGNMFIDITNALFSKDVNINFKTRDKDKT